MNANGIETQREAAALLGLRDQQEVSDYVSWRHVPRPQKLKALADRLGCGVERLLPDSEAPGKPAKRAAVDRRTGRDRRKAVA